MSTLFPRIEPQTPAVAPRAPASVFGGLTDLLAVLIGFSIPVSTSLAEIVTALFVACWLLAGNWRERCKVIATNSVARLSLALFGLLLIGTTWSSASWSEAFRCLLKYREFLYLPLLVPVFQDARLRQAGLRGFSLGALAMLGMSYFEWLSGADLGQASAPNDHVITKDRIIHSLLMALWVYFCAQQIAQRRGSIWWNAVVIVLAIPNILFLVQGRTGYLLLGSLTVLLMSQQFGKRGLVVAGLLVALGGGGAYAASGTVRARVAQTILQVQNKLGTSTEKVWDPRLEFYTNTLEMIARHPWLGTGTGSFSGEYAQAGAGRDWPKTTDPHNEFLHLAVQTGVPGGLLFVALLAWQWHAAGRLPTFESRLGRGVVLAIALGSLFNSLILSVTGGLVWSYFSGMAFAELSGTADQVASPAVDSEAPRAAA